MTNQTLTLAGIADRVVIRRDAYGAPHIEAQSDADGFFALGWCTASDRLFQMDFNRRTMLGRLSELIASAGTLASDRLFRTLGIEEVAARILAQLPAETRELLNAYVAGVNAWIAEHPARREAEYQLLKIDAIEAWRAEDSLAVLRLIGWQLSGDFDKELLGWQLMQAVGPDIAQLLYPDTPASEQRQHMREQWPLADGDLILSLGSEARESLGRGDSGTNIWVIDGSRTASGGPILANDPHLNLYTPGVWYEASLATPSFRVSGFTFAGLPFMAIGQNAQLAWGASNWPADTQDLFVETLDATGMQYRDADDSWQPLEIEEVLIEQRGCDPEILRIARTPRGVIMRQTAEGQALALRWTGFDASDEITCFLEAARSTSVSEFLRAFRTFECPTQNFYVIDHEGTIGGVHAGRVPLRTRGESSWPQEAHDPAAQWQGSIPIEEFAPTIGSTVGFLANANNKPVEPPSGAPTGCRFTPPLRYQRILDLLGGRSDWTPELTIAMQHDTHNLSAVQQLAALRQSVAQAPVMCETPAMQLDWERMLGWSGYHADDLRATAVWHLCALELARLLIEPLIGPELWTLYQDHLDPQHLLLLDWLEAGASAQLCLAGAASPTPSLLQAAFARAWSDCEQLFEAGESWDWSQLHAMRLVHPLRLPIGAPGGIRHPHPGGRHTLFVGNCWPSQGWGCNHGVSLRFVAWVDAAGAVRSRSLVMPGESGDPTSPHFTDQLSLLTAPALRDRPFDATDIDALPIDCIFLKKSD